jgi:hypothetical protein
MEHDHAARSAAMERLEAFIGEWAIEASFSAAPAGVIGRAVFEWILGRQFVMERAEVPDAPESIAIVGLLRLTRHRPRVCDGVQQWRVDARAGFCGLHAAGVLAAVHWDVLQRWPAHPWPLRDFRGRLELGAGL